MLSLIILVTFTKFNTAKFIKLFKESWPTTCKQTQNTEGSDHQKMDNGIPISMNFRWLTPFDMGISIMKKNKNPYERLKFKHHTIF